MADSGGGCFTRCCSFFFTLGLAALFMWLSLRVSSPNCSLEQFYIPSLNQTLNSTRDTNLTFVVALKNTNKDKGVYYDPVNITFYDSPNRSHSIGNYTIPKFRQGHNKKAMKNGTVETTGLDRQAVFRAVSANGSAVFRVDLATSVRYRIIFFKTKRHKIRVGGNVEVNGNGTKVNSKKGIKLKSGADKKSTAGVYCLGQVGVNFFILVLLNLWWW
ncbi:hypothetical protein Tsubulata_017099 [Turnera subulata]|uniref:Late embryogenesis abundant protein LEA-2 subgroup domain-containing protein n=1 Tax=Turnera subulata TaxID=218843 RepID=A0A9Q0FJ77_9ROSI|nr:hypothetical protein Tsubulata_017099 [Turnera subulata]